MKYILITITFLSTHVVYSQGLEEIWVLTAKMDVLNDSIISLQPDSLNKYTDVLPDSSYFSQYGFLIEFSDNNSVSYGNIGQHIKSGHYLQYNDTIKFQADTLKIKAIKNQDLLTVLDLDKTNWQNSHFIFDRLNSRSIKNVENSIQDFRMKQYWHIKTDSLSKSFGINLLLTDSSRVIIHRRYDDWYSETTSGLFQLNQYKNNLFLYIIDEMSLDEYFFHIFSKEDDVYFSESFERGRNVEKPTRFINSFSNINLPTLKDLKSISNKLIGNWRSSGSSFPFDARLSEFDSIVDTYYYCRFSKNKFEIRYGGTLLKEGQRVPKSVKYIGNWKIGRTGKYLELYPENDYLIYLTIKKLTKKEAIISISTEAVDDDWSEIKNSIELRKVVRQNK